MAFKRSPVQQNGLKLTIALEIVQIKLPGDIQHCKRENELKLYKTDIIQFNYQDLNDIGK